MYNFSSIKICFKNMIDIILFLFFGFKDIFGGLVMVVTWRVEEKLLWVAVAGSKGRRDHV